MNCISILIKDYLPFSFIQILKPGILFWYTDINWQQKFALDLTFAFFVVNNYNIHILSLFEFLSDKATDKSSFKLSSQHH